MYSFIPELMIRVFILNFMLSFIQQASLWVTLLLYTLPIVSCCIVCPSLPPHSRLWSYQASVSCLPFQCTSGLETGVACCQSSYKLLHVFKCLKVILAVGLQQLLVFVLVFHHELRPFLSIFELRYRIAQNFDWEILTFLTVSSYSQKLLHQKY